MHRHKHVRDSPTPGIKANHETPSVDSGIRMLSVKLSDGNTEGRCT